ncbi:MAG: glycosyltransferase family 2 protein [Actinomycetia bacterium]|jgi:cellulose synthase/poly-beta-1,6-N-acetylglucosamine synthase-like glycosyltransferase|nr:glycosyltransferase family 2 protein [Actinomycetes bacterium]
MPTVSSSAAPEPAAQPDGWPPVSVVMPVLEEERHLREAVEHVLAQDYPGELELVMALGPSRDRTDAIAAELVGEHPGRVRSVRNPTGTTPAGLNAAVGAARHPVVVRVDGHALFPGDYVRTAVEVLMETGADNVGGIMAAEGVTPFEQAVARAMTSPFGVGNARFHTGGEPGPADTVYLGVFRRAALERVGGYDEAYLRAQDWEMNLRIRRTGGLVWFTPRLRVSYRPRPDLRSLARQYFHYGRWRRTVMRSHQGTASLRYLAPPVAVLGVLAGLAAAPWWRPALALPAGYAALVVGASAVTARGLPPAGQAWLPAVYATMHGAWGVGFLLSPRGLAAGSPEGSR